MEDTREALVRRARDVAGQDALAVPLETHVQAVGIAIPAGEADLVVVTRVEGVQEPDLTH